MTKKLIELTQQAKKLRNSLTKDLKSENIKTSWTKKTIKKKLHVYVSKTILINKLEITDCIQKMEATMMSFLFWALILKIILNTVSQYFKRIPGIIWLTVLPGMSYGMSHLKILLSKRLLASNKSVKNKTNMWVYKVCGSDTSLSLFLKRCCLLYIYMVRFIYGLYIWFRPYKGTTNYSVRVWKTRFFCGLVQNMRLQVDYCIWMWCQELVAIAICDMLWVRMSPAAQNLWTEMWDSSSFEKTSVYDTTGRKQLAF